MGALAVLGVQHVLAFYAGAVIVPLVISQGLGLDGTTTVHLINADLLTCGIATIIQSAGLGPKIGVRLPLIQGVTFTAVSPLIAIGLAAFGMLVLVTDGVNKQSVVAGPLLVYCGAAVYLRSEYWIDLSPLTAFGMVVLGCLLLLSRSSLIPYKTAKHPPQ
mgnify:CR=1 FL=1